MLWKNRWTGGWFLRRVADQPNRARTQDNQILISAYDEILSRSSSYSCRLMIGELPVRPAGFHSCLMIGELPVRPGFSCVQDVPTGSRIQHSFMTRDKHRVWCCSGN